MIETRQISKTFNAGRPNQENVLHDISLTINGRETTVIKGPSGSGKTTLLGILGCMAKPTSGRMFLEGKEVTSLPERFLAEIRRSTFGFIFQHLNLVRGITALENVMLPAYPNGEKYSVLRCRAQETLEMFNIADRGPIRIELLSGGEAQRVAIARALINSPSVVIADEPTAHLDTRLSHEFMGIMQGLKERGTTVIISSHDPIVFEAQQVDRVIEMRDGCIVSRG